MMVLIAVLMVALLGMAGMTMDAGKLLVTYRTLQATSDDAALAGAITLPANNATTIATQYSAVAGNGNARTLLNGATMVSGYPVAKCLSSLQSLGYVCNSPANANAVQVKQQITVPVPFMRVLGFRQVTLSTVSTARTGLIDIGSSVSAYTIITSPNNNQYNGPVVSTNTSGPSSYWVTPSGNGYTDPDVAWVVPAGGNGTSNFNYPTGNYVYVSNALTGITAITQGMVNSDDTISLYLYDTTTNTPTQTGPTFNSTGDCNNGTGGYCNAPLLFSYSGLSVTHTYRLVASVSNSGGGVTGLLLQAKGYSPAALYRDQ